MSARRPLVILTVLGLGAVSGMLVPAAEPQAPLHYRRVYVPQEEVDRVVRGLLPMKRDEFERRIEQAQATSGNQRGADQVRIASAEYRAHLEGDALVGGQAELAVVHSQAGPALLDLDPANFALHGATWSGTTPRAARWGVNPDGRLVCLVEESGTLALSWSMAGERDERGDLTFRLRLPASPRQQLRLVLPADLTLTADQAIVTQIGPADDSQSSTAGLINWTVEVPGGGQVVLQVAKQRASPETESLVLVKEQATCTIHRGTIDVETAFDLDVLHKPLAQLVLACDESLELVSIRQGEASLAWSPLGSMDRGSTDRQRRFVVSLSPPLLGDADVIRVSAVANWSGRGAARLPRLQILNATWQEGRTTVIAEGSLQIRATAQTGCRASGFTPATPLRPENQWQFQQFLPGAGIQIALDDAPPQVEEFSATTLEFGPTQITGVYSSEISVAAGRRFELHAEIPRTWIVDSIDVQPADALADRALANRGNGPQLLKLALRRPIAEGRPVRLVVRAHHRRPPKDEWLAGEFFSIVRLADVRSARRLVAWQVTDAAAQLSLSGDENLRRLDPTQLPPADLRLFDAPPGAMLFEVDQSAEALRARLVQTSPRYHADLLVRATIDRDEVTEQWRVVCTPEDAAVGRLLVHCRPPLTELGQWRIAGEDPREVAVRQLESTPASSDEGVFEVTLARPRQTPFEITAEFRRRADRQELSLVSLPAATAQSGSIEVHSAHGRQLAIDPQGLRAMSPSRSSADAATLRGAYRYDPGRAASLRWHTSHAGQALPLAWVESLQLTSRCMADGTAQHEAIWTIQNVGHDRFVFRLPPGAASVQAKIADQPVVGLVALDHSGEFSAPLPSGRSCVIQVTYATHDQTASWRWSNEFRDPRPQCDLPILASAWRVQLAPGLELGSSRLVRARVLSDAAASSSPSSAGESESGWTSYDLNPLAIVPSGLRVYRTATIVAWSWCLGLATAAMVVRLAAGRWASLVLIAGIVVATLSILPAEFMPLAIGGLVGLSVGAGWLLLVPRGFAVPARGNGAVPRSTASFLRPPLGAGLLLVAVASASLGQAAKPGPATRPEPPSRRVVIPVDSERQPVGDYVFLEPDFYDALLKLTDRSTLATPDWLLSAAIYRPTVTAKVGSPRVQVEEIAATLDVETFRAEAAVELNLRRAQIHLLERRARLDGDSVLPEWSADGSRLRVLVPQPGKHRLELVFGAMVQVVGERERLEMTIPQVADSRLELPASGGRIQVAVARGSTVADESTGGRTIHLGHLGQFALSWPIGLDDTDAPARIEAEQLLLWTVRPGSVVAEGKLRLRPVGGKIREVAVEIDPRLRVLPTLAMGIVARQWVDSAGPVNLLRVVLAEPAATEVTVPISLLWAESSGIGMLTLPKVTVQADKVIRAWSGVALSGNLQWKSPLAPRKGDPSSDDFAEAWSEPLAGPVVALDASQPALPALLTQPIEPRVTASQVVQCGVSSSSIGVQYSVALAGLSPDAFQHRLKVSPGLQVTAVQMSAGGIPLRADWLQTSDGTVLVTQHQAPATQQELKLVGQVAVTPGQRTVAAPLVEYAGAADSQLDLRIFRQADVQLSVVADPSVWAGTDDLDLGTHRDGLGRLAMALRRLPGAPDRPPSIAVEQNRPEPFGHLLVRLVPGETEWSVEIDLLVELESGVLDALRLELPPSLALPLTISPAVEHEVVKVAGQTGQLLIVRPQRAIDRSLRLAIRGQLHAADPQQAMLPAITLRGAPRVRHLVALPARISGRRIEWETSGLQAIDSSALPGDAASHPAGYELFEAVAARPTAAAQVRATSALAPLVQLANHQLNVHRDGTLAGRLRLDVVPRGAQHLELVMPPGCRLIHVAVEDVPAQLIDRGAGRWLLPTLGDQLPQRIDVVYSASLAPSVGVAGTADFTPPQIAGAVVEHSRWNIEPLRWTEIERGAVRIHLPAPDQRQGDRRLAWAALAIGVSALVARLIARDAARGWLARHAPLLLGLAGSVWLAAGTVPWLGWIPIFLAISLAIRSPWPRALDQPLSSVFRRSGLG